MTAMTNVYLRDNQVISVPCAGRGGITYETGPVRIEEPKAEDVASAISECLEISKGQMGTSVPNLRGYKSPVMAALKLKSLSKFYVNVAMCAVYINDGKHMVLPYTPARDGRGFEMRELAKAVDAEQLGQAVLDVLLAAPRLNP
jgi:hypothetical protein